MRNRWSRAARSLLAGLLALGVAGCRDLLPDSATATTSTSVAGAPTLIPEPPTNRVAPLTVVFCGDTSADYPRQLFANTTSALADWTDALDRPGTPGATIFINSFERDGNLLVIQVPSVPSAPPPPVLEPTPGRQSGGNPFDRPESKQQTATALEQIAATTVAGNAQAIRSYEATLTTVRTTQTQVLAEIRKQTMLLRKMDPPVASDPTDLRGCLTLAAERLRGTSGRKLLFLSTSLDSSGLEDKASAGQLTGVEVYVLNLICAGGQGCSRERTAWSAAFSSRGVLCMRLYDPAEKAALENPFVRPCGG